MADFFPVTSMRNLLGLIVILLGVGFLLQQLDIANADRFMDLWWPVLIMALGVIMWANNRRQWAGPAIIFGIGAILLVDQFDLLNTSAWNLFWPAVVIVVGLRILIGRRPADHTPPETGSAEANAVFSGVDRKVTGPFTAASTSAWFGGTKIDLREAQFAPQTTLNVSAGFGGIEVIVPRHVRVVSNVTAILGGAEDKSSPDSTATHTLTIAGSVILGGVTIKN